MRDAAELFAESVESPDPRRREPDVRDEARRHVHLRPELRHREVVQDVDRAEVYLDRLADGQVHFLARDQHVILTVRIVRIDAERIGRR